MTQIYEVCVSCALQKVIRYGEKEWGAGFGQNDGPCPGGHPLTASPWPIFDAHCLLPALVSSWVNLGNNFYPTNFTGILKE